MEVKGVAVKSIQLFVEKKHSDRYNEWLNSLSEKSKLIFNGRIIDGAWYDMHDAVVEPTDKICKLFYNGSERGAWESGKFSAEIGLKGIYSFFIKVLSPEFLISRASNIISTYWRPCEIKAGKTDKNIAFLHIIKFDEPNNLVEQRIGGWIEKAFEICGCKNLNISITKSLAKGDELTEYKSIWG